MTHAKERDWNVGDRDLENRLRHLCAGVESNPAHRDRLEEQLLRARTAHVARAPQTRFRSMAANWLAARRVRISLPAAAAVALAMGIAWIGLTGRGSLDGARPAWALEQSIAVLQNVRTVHMAGMQASGTPFECWIRAQPGGERVECLRFESPDVVVVVRGEEVQAYFPRNNTAELLSGSFTQAVRAWHLVVELRPWVGDTWLTQLQGQATNWEESAWRDERGRDLIFVRCSHPRMGISFELTFDAASKLIVAARQWQNLTRDGDPAFDIRQIEYDVDVPDERFALRVAPSARIYDGRNNAECRTLLDQAESLFSQKQYTDAIAAYLQIYEQFPAQNDAEHALMMIGLCYEWLGDLEEARTWLERATREYPDLRGWSETTYFYLGSIQRRLGQTDEALASYRKCVELCRGVRDPLGFPWRTAVEASKSLENAGD